MGLSIGGKTYNGCATYINSDQLYVDTGMVNPVTGRPRTSTMTSIHEFVKDGLYRTTLGRLRQAYAMTEFLADVKEATDDLRVLIEVPDRLLDTQNENAKRGLAALKYLYSLKEKGLTVDSTPAIEKALGIVSSHVVPCIGFGTDLRKFSFTDTNGNVIPDNSEVLLDGSSKNMLYYDKPVFFFCESGVNFRHIYVEGYGYTIPADSSVVYVASYGVDSNLNTKFDVFQGFNGYVMKAVTGTDKVWDWTLGLPKIKRSDGSIVRIGWEPVPYDFCKDSKHNQIRVDTPYKPDIFNIIGETSSNVTFTLPAKTNFDYVGVGNFQQGNGIDISTRVYPQGVYNLVYSNGGYLSAPLPYNLLTLNSASLGDGVLHQEIFVNYKENSNYNPKYHRYYYSKSSSNNNYYLGFTGWWGSYY